VGFLFKPSVFTDLAAFASRPDCIGMQSSHSRRFASNFDARHGNPYSQLHGVGLRRTQGAAATRRKTHVSVEMRVFLSLRKNLLPLPNHERRRRTTNRFTSARFFHLPKIRAAPSSQCGQTPRNPPYSGVCIDRKKGNIAITMNSRVNIASCIVVVSTFVRVEIHRHFHYRVSFTRSPSHQSPRAYHLSCRERRPNRFLIV